MRVYVAQCGHARCGTDDEADEERGDQPHRASAIGLRLNSDGAFGRCRCVSTFETELGPDVIDLGREIFQPARCLTKIAPHPI